MNKINRKLKDKVNERSLNILGYLLFLSLFILSLPILILIGAIKCPIRFYKYVSCKVNNKKPDTYWW